jgi:cytochrome c553
MCVGCHEIPGYKASFPTVYHVPKITGQTAKYIEASLQAYRKGDRGHPTMRAIAGSLSDKDIADLAALYGSK